MKLAIYNEDGVMQLVLTPQSEFEKDAIRYMETYQNSVIIKRGTFYDCQGGWARHGDYETSLIIRATKE